MILLIGPRLDRPSAIGDEGRARAASLGVAAVVTVVVTLAAGLTSGLLDAVQLAGLGGGLVAAGTALLDRESLDGLAVGHFCFMPGGLLCLGGVAAATLVGGPGGFLLALGSTLAALGLASAWANVTHDTTVRAMKQGWAGVFLPFVAGVVLSIVAAFALLLWEFGVAPGVPSLSTLLFLLAFTASAVCLSLMRLPLAHLLAVPREELAQRRAQWRDTARVFVAACLAGWFLVGVLELVGATTGLYRTPGLALLLGVLSTVWVRLPAFLVGVGAVLVALLAALARRATAGNADWLAGPALGMLALFAIPFPILVLLLSGRGGAAGLAGAAFVAALILVAGMLFMLCYSAGPLAVQVGVLPDRAGSLSLASAGLLVAGIGAAALRVPGPVVFACVAGSMVVWDVGEFGLGLTVELGHRPDTRRLELLHGVAAVGLAVGAVVLATGLAVLFGRVGPQGPVLSAVVLAVAGVLALLGPIRG
ncbi:DUF7519 family protein [Halorientalis pallida]|uniref:DUF7519 family protein n=1 Tax=Halorientalis pallida TaxID=2479928 RepID=UPI00187D0F26|nr:hypothetical protein [Halorientalis pallida]